MEFQQVIDARQSVISFNGNQVSDIDEIAKFI